MELLIIFSCFAKISKLFIRNIRLASYRTIIYKLYSASFCLQNQAKSPPPLSFRLPSQYPRNSPAAQTGKQDFRNFTAGRGPFKEQNPHKKKDQKLKKPSNQSHWQRRR